MALKRHIDMIKNQERLATCHQDLQKVFNEVSKLINCVVIYGTRSPAEQFELYKKGRVQVNGVWTITDKKSVVTNCDGTIKKSNHNFNPSLAVDIMPDPLDWKDDIRTAYFAGIVIAVAASLGVNITWGGDWNRNNNLKDQTLMDYAHFELTQGG
jgi:hypothetical protein